MGILAADYKLRIIELYFRLKLITPEVN